MSAIKIFADGACEPNPGPGGWGTIVRTATAETELSGYESDSTNNRMELMAVIAGLEFVTEPSSITVISDARYVIDGASAWLARWKKNGWRRGKNGTLMNVDLWQRLDAAAAKHAVTWRWVKGHAGHPENERADALANAALRQQSIVEPQPSPSAPPVVTPVAAPPKPKRPRKVAKPAQRPPLPAWAIQTLQLARTIASAQNDPESALQAYQFAVKFLLDDIDTRSELS